MIFSGLGAGNGVEEIIVRSVVGLFGGLVLGAVAGWMGSFVIQDQLDVPSEEKSTDSPPEVAATVKEPRAERPRTQAAAN